MKQTFFVRWQDILENPVPLSSLFVKYPTLKDADEVSGLITCTTTCIAIQFNVPIVCFLYYKFNLLIFPTNVIIQRQLLTILYTICPEIDENK